MGTWTFSQETCVPAVLPIILTMACRICVHSYSDPEFISVDIYSMSNYKNFLLTWGAIVTFVCSLSPSHANSLDLYSEVCFPLSAANFFAVSISLLINNAKIKHYTFTTLVTRLHARLELKSLSMCQHSWSSSVTQLNIFLWNYSQVQAQYWIDRYFSPQRFYLQCVEVNL